MTEDATNENHKVLGIEHKGWNAGYFENSYGRDTFFVGYAWRYPGMLGVQHLEGMVSVGVNRGYKYCFGDTGRNSDDPNLCPHAALGVSWTQWRVVPSIKLFGDAVTFQPEIKF